MPFIRQITGAAVVVVVVVVVVDPVGMKDSGVDVRPLFVSVRSSFKMGLTGMKVNHICLSALPKWLHSLFF